MNSKVKTYNVIAPFILHKRILISKDPSINIKVYTKESFFDLFLGSLDNLDTLNIAKNENMNYGECLVYSPYIPFIKDNPKHTRTKELKKLKDNNKINTNFIAQNNFKKNPIFIYGYSDKNDRDLFEVLNHVSLKYTYKDYNLNLKPVSYFEYSDARNEIGETFNRISKLIDDGINEKDITIICSNTYLILLNIYAPLFNLNLNFDNPNLFQNQESLKLYVDCLENNEIIKENYSDVLSQYIDAINELKEKGYSSENIALFIKKSLQKVKVDRKNIGIKVYTSLENASPNKYLFVVGFNDEVLSAKKDNEYLSDIEKLDDTFLLTSYEITKNRREQFKLLLSLTDNAILSYSSQNSINNSQKISDLEEFNIVDRGLDVFSKERYSLKFDQLILDLLKDDESKYGVVSSLNQYLDKKIGNNFNTYNANFKAKNKLANNDLITLSNTNTSLFNKCPMSYFFKYCLNVLDESNNYSIALGNIAHKAIENNEIIDENNFGNYIVDSCFNNKEIFYLKKRIKTNAEMRKILNDFVSYFKPDFKEYHEMKLSYNLDEKTILEGRLDFVLASKQEYLVMDFKSSPKEYNEVLNYFGFDSQLQIYLFLFNSINNNIVPIGALFAPLYSSSLDNNSKDFIYKGYIVNKDLLSDIISKDELKKYCSIPRNSINFDTLKRDQIHLLENLKKTSINMRKGIYPFTPIRCKANKKLNSCAFCNYKDMCFYEAKDIIYVEIPDELKKNKSSNDDDLDGGNN